MNVANGQGKWRMEGSVSLEVVKDEGRDATRVRYGKTDS